MATSLLNVVRMRPLKLDSLGVLKSPLVASFCTQSENPAKPEKNPAKKTVEASDERATLIAYKTAVAFPVRFTRADIFQTNSLDEAKLATAETVVVTAATEAMSSDTVLDLISTSKSGHSSTTELTSSSSSESDSDSDSESECDQTEFEAETKSLSSDLSKSAGQKKKTVSKITTKKEDNQNNNEQYSHVLASETIPEKSTEAAQASVAPEICSAIEYSPGLPSFEASAASSAVPEICNAIEHSPELPSFEASASAASPAALDAQTSVKVVIEAETSENAPTNVPFGTTSAENAAVTADAASEIFVPVESGPGTAEAARQMQTDAGVEPSDEAGAAPHPDPEEPFDNSTYKNYQHHSYNLYTFVDQDVEMAKFRLPQPSSGRPSPRH